MQLTHKSMRGSFWDADHAPSESLLHAAAQMSKATFQRRGTRVGEEMQAFEREDVEAEGVLVGIDGTGVPMAAREVEGVTGKQADGTANTIVCFTADSRDPKTGEPRKCTNGGAGGVEWRSEFDTRLRQLALWNDVSRLRK